jgi:ParB family chromosome partitioning protein
MDVVDIPLRAIDVSHLNTRKNLDAGIEDASLDDLARSIEEQGLLNPVQVRRVGSDRFELISGQRRFLACRKLGMDAVPASVVDLTDHQAVAVSLIENVQRADMHPLDKAEAFRVLADQSGSVDAVASQTGVGVRTVRKYLSLLRLPPELRGRVTTRSGPAGVGVMAELAQRFDDADEMVAAFDKVSGFTGAVAEQILRRSSGDLGSLDPLVDAAIAGEFDRFRCGTSIETCPHIPEAVRPTVRRLVGAMAAGGPGAN